MFHVEQRFDVIVVGGGHAGCEAAAAAARRGARVALVTQRADRVGVMSCNPSIGGLGKGHLVREVDALGGLMAKAADAAAIHHRMLNRSKGLAVQGPRIQADRALYQQAVGELLGAYNGLTIVEAEAASLEVASGVSTGIVTSGGVTISAAAIVLATGTFLGGRLFQGRARAAGGRVEEAAATMLGVQLRELGLPMGRLKTGTPPRLDGRTIDWVRLAGQPSDVDPWTMSPMTKRRLLPQVACAITRTDSAVHDIIRSGLHESPLYGDDIALDGRGPRYCPSIEDKVHRFGDRDGHQIFLEPEGLGTSIVYPNGISTSLGVETQERMVAAIAGLEHARISVPGYAVEYDFIDPRALDHRLALGALPGIFCAGQLNGTTGYEEAAAQGLIAGANAAAHALGSADLLLDRATSYIGVMVDDLVLQGVSEPYRMLTARAEFRLALRSDNAERRLSYIADEHGLLGAAQRIHVAGRTRQRERAQAGSLDGIDADIVREIAEDARYAPYLTRQADEIARMRRDGAVAIATGARLRAVPGLSSEMIERLAAASPRTLGEASRVRGVTPAALTTLWLDARRTGA